MYRLYLYHRSLLYQSGHYYTIDDTLLNAMSGTLELAATIILIVCTTYPADAFIDGVPFTNRNVGLFVVVEPICTLLRVLIYVLFVPVSIINTKSYITFVLRTGKLVIFNDISTVGAVKVLIFELPAEYETVKLDDAVIEVYPSIIRLI